MGHKFTKDPTVLFNKAFLIPLALLFTANVFAQTQLEMELRDVVKRRSLVGMGASRSRGEYVKEYAAYGRRKSTSNVPLQMNDLFSFASCAKSMTAFVAATLVEEGVLNWDSTLGQLLPDYEMHPGFRDVPFEALFTHTAGFPNIWSDQDLTYMDQLGGLQGREWAIRNSLRQAPLYQPGSRFEYSNVGYTLAGKIMENITDIYWDALVKERVFKPLELNRCGFETYASDSIDEPWGHVPTPNGGWKPNDYDLPKAMSPAGTIHCSIIEWQVYLQLWTDGASGNARLISEDSYQRLLSPVIEAGDGLYYTYGGWYAKDVQGLGTIYQHSGNNGRHTAEVWLVPQIETSLVTVQNNGQTNATKLASEEILTNMLQRALNEN